MEITVTWSANLPMPAEMRIRLLGKKIFQRWMLSGGIMSAFAKRTLRYILVGGGRAQSKMMVEPHSTGRKYLL